MVHFWHPRRLRRSSRVDIVTEMQHRSRVGGLHISLVLPATANSVGGLPWLTKESQALAKAQNCRRTALWGIPLKGAQNK